MRSRLIFILISIETIKVGYTGFSEKRLLNYLFDPRRIDCHNPLERPIANDTQPLEVRIKFALTQIIDVDEKNQILHTNIWLDMKWSDYHFKWDPAKYGNIDKVIIPPHKVWKPDILMYNSADEKFDGTYATNVVATNDGMMLYVPPGMFKSTCKMEIAWFPFDTQHCELKFGSWTYDGDFIDLKLQCNNDSYQNKTGNCTIFGLADNSTYTENGEWNLLGAHLIRNVEKYDCCDALYMDIKLFIVIHRRALYYTFNLIIPCVLISTMTLLVFILPPDAGEKISLGVTILLSLTMFLLLVADAMPQTSGALPLLGMYFSCIMIMCSTSVVFTVLVLNYHHRDAALEPVPVWISKFINTWMAQALRMKSPASTRTTARFHLEDTSTPPPGEDAKKVHFPQTKYVRHKTDISSGPSGGCVSPSLMANIRDMEDNFRVIRLTGNTVEPPSYDNCFSVADKVASNTSHLRQSETFRSVLEDGSGSNTAPCLTSNWCSTQMELQAIILELRHITAKIREDELEMIVAKEWKFAARVIDRFCLIIFSLFTVITTTSILFLAPRFAKM